MQLPLFTPEVSWRPPDMASLPDWSGAKRVSYDTETKDPTLPKMIGVRHGGHIIGFSFAIEDGPKHYLPIRHEGGDNLDEQQVLGYMRAQAANFKGELVGAKLEYDLDYTSQEGIEFKQTKFFRDVQIADPLIYELHDRYGLDPIAARYGIPGKKEDILVEAGLAYCSKEERKRKDHIKRFLYRFPARYVGEYAEQDAVVPLQILRKQERLISEHDLWRIWDLESKVLPVLVRMRRRGLRVDLEHLDKVERWAFEKERECLEYVWRETGVRIEVGEVWKADKLAPALTSIGYKLNMTSQGKANIDKDVLAEINHPVAKNLAVARKVNKVRTTFAASVRTHIVNGRIHCTFNQIIGENEETDERKGARYGRLSCENPNLQQQPARDDFAPFWRKIYIPEEGALLAAPDYSQQEPRWTTHFAALVDLPGAKAAAQAYHDNPNLDNHQFMADLTGLPRKYAKNIYLGLCYGEGGAKLCHDIGLPTRWALSTGKWPNRELKFYSTREEATTAGRNYEDKRVYEAAGEEGQKILDAFDQRAPFIRKLAKKCSATAGKRGYIITGGGRHLHFPQRDDGTYDWLHKALNRLIQGTSADQTKAALVELDAQGFFLQLQVHDEILASVANDNMGKQMGAVMRDVMPALVPFKVDVELGSSWSPDDQRKAA